MTQKINNDVTNTVDTIDYVMQWITGMWEGMPIELKAFILSVFVISILMQWVKKALLTKKPKSQRIRLLWVASLPLGLVLAGIGYILAEGEIHLGYWVVIGLTSGSTAMGVHFMTVKILWPALQVVGSVVWSRVMLVAKGVPKDAS